MDNPTVNRLIVWLRQQLTISRPSGDVVRFEIRHLSEAKLGHTVATYEPSNKPTEDWFESLAVQALNAAECDAAGLPGSSQGYVLVSFREKSPEKIDARFAMPRQFAGDESGDSGFASEPATTKGVLTQLMRYIDGLQRANMAMTSTVVNAQQRTINRLSEQNEKMQEQKVQLFEMTEDLMSAKADRDMKIKSAETRQRAIEEMIPDAKLLIGTVANKLAGRKVSDVEDPKTVLFKRFLSSLDENQRTTILGSLRPEQMLALTEMQGEGEN